MSVCPNRWLTGYKIRYISMTLRGRVGFAVRSRVSATYRIMAVGVCMVRIWMGYLGIKCFVLSLVPLAYL